MYQDIITTIENLDVYKISKERKLVLTPLIEYIQNKVNNSENINLNFICTHNSRRSHLSQIWAQTLAVYFKINNAYCYSGGTEARFCPACWQRIPFDGKRQDCCKR